MIVVEFYTIFILVLYCIVYVLQSFLINIVNFIAITCPIVEIGDFLFLFLILNNGRCLKVQKFKLSSVGGVQSGYKRHHAKFC